MGIKSNKTPKKKIVDVQIEKIGYFTIEVKVIAEDTTSDIIEIDPSMEPGLGTVRLSDRRVDSYKFFGNELTYLVEKQAGALAGCIFKTDKLGVRFLDNYDISYFEVIGCSVYMRWEDDKSVQKILIDDFEIEVAVSENKLFPTKPSVQIINKNFSGNI